MTQVLNATKFNTTQNWLVFLITTSVIQFKLANVKIHLLLKEERQLHYNKAERDSVSFVT